MSETGAGSPTERALVSAAEWYEGHRNSRGNVNRNVMAAGIAVERILRDSFPLDADTVTTNGGGQVRGLSGTMIANILAQHGETRPFASEAGRTSRGTIQMSVKLGQLVTDAFNGATPTEADRLIVADALEEYFIGRIRDDYLNKQRIKVALDTRKPVAKVVSDILTAAQARADATAAGTVLQHLVGAKLELRFPDEEIGRDRANAADQQTDRQGDFQIGSTAFHVTMSPMAKLADRARANIMDGYRPVVIVPENKVDFAVGLFDSVGLGELVSVQSAETFIGTNIEELAGYGTTNIRAGVVALVRRYNERIEAVEDDKSLRIEEPAWFPALSGEWDTPYYFSYNGNEAQ